MLVKSLTVRHPSGLNSQYSRADVYPMWRKVLSVTSLLGLKYPQRELVHFVSALVKAWNFILFQRQMQFYIKTMLHQFLPDERYKIIVSVLFIVYFRVYSIAFRRHGDCNCCPDLIKNGLLRWNYLINGMR